MGKANKNKKRKERQQKRLKHKENYEQLLKKALHVSGTPPRGINNKPCGTQKKRAQLPGFKKFSDDKVKKSPKRLQQKPKFQQTSYVQKLIASIKKRMMGTPMKKTSPLYKRKLQFKSPTKFANTLKERNSPKKCRASKVHESFITTDLTNSSDDDDVIFVEPNHLQICLDDINDEAMVYEDNSGTEPLLSPSSLLYEDKTGSEPLLIADSLLYELVDNKNKVPPSSTNCTARTNDSVIVLEDDETVEDYIPLPADERRNKKTNKGVAAGIKTPKERPVHKKDSIFNSVEKRQISVYSTNAYNPAPVAGNTKGSKRPIIIDGSNVAFGHGLCTQFSAEGIKICIDYFTKMGHNVKAVIPMFRKNPQKSSNPELLDQLHKDGKIVLSPCKNLPGQQAISYDDRFILQLAYEREAAIVSNDNYRDLIRENPAFKHIIEKRVLGYLWCDDIFIVPKDPYGRWGPTLEEILHF